MIIKMNTLSTIVLHIYYLFHVLYVTTGASLPFLVTLVAVPASSEVSFLIIVTLWDYTSSVIIPTRNPSKYR